MITVISERTPTSKDKLPKPKELKGIKPLFSVKWGGATACQVFVKGADVWVNHHDWCSVSVYGAKVKSNRHYGYSDDRNPEECEVCKHNINKSCAKGGHHAAEKG